MAKLEHLSLSALQAKREALIEDIKYYENQIVIVKSTLICWVYASYIDAINKKIHRIDAEIALREKNGNI